MGLPGTTEGIGATDGVAEAVEVGMGGPVMLVFMIASTGSIMMDGWAMIECLSLLFEVGRETDGWMM